MVKQKKFARLAKERWEKKRIKEINDTENKRKMKPVREGKKKSRKIQQKKRAENIRNLRLARKIQKKYRDKERKNVSNCKLTVCFANQMQLGKHIACTPKPPECSPPNISSRN